jgi:hypothetical protein
MGGREACPGWIPASSGTRFPSAQWGAPRNDETTCLFLKNVLFHDCIGPVDKPMGVKPYRMNSMNLGEMLLQVGDE